MADPAPFQPTMTVCTPLIAGKRQDLQLQIETDRYVRIGIPLGDKPAALMTVDEFNKAGISPLSMLNESETLPPALEQAPEERELGKVGENDFGYIGIPIIPDGGPDTKFAFKIWLQNFAVQKEKGSVAIKLEVRTDDNDNPWTLSAKPTAEKLVPEPRITSFTADRYRVVEGDGVALEWKIEPAGNFKLKGTKTPVEGKNKGEGRWEDMVLEGTQQDFTLEAWAGEKKPDSPDTRRLYIGIISGTQFKPIALGWSPRPGVLGLYAHPRRGRLYALLRFPNSPYASLWYTEHGFTPERAEWREATRKPDPKKPDQPLIKPLIPVAAARRPGAIFNDKLFLIGGDCCNPNLPGSGFGYCDLNEDTGLDWHEVGKQEVGKKDRWSWPDGMAERMGHAVVALPDEKGLWIMGGWRPDGGICDDIWQFDGTNSPWKKVEGLRLPRCLFGATATRAAVWWVGGFGSPGGTPNDGFVRRCDIRGSSKSWEEMPKIVGLPTDEKGLPTYQYCASVLFSRERETDTPRGIVKTDASDEKYFFFDKVDDWKPYEYFQGKGSEALLPPHKWYHMQSAVFRDAVFFRTLTADETQAGNIITYLVFN